MVFNGFNMFLLWGFIWFLMVFIGFYEFYMV